MIVFNRGSPLPGNQVRSAHSSRGQKNGGSGSLPVSPSLENLLHQPPAMAGGNTSSMLCDHPKRPRRWGGKIGDRPS